MARNHGNAVAALGVVKRVERGLNRLGSELATTVSEGGVRGVYHLLRERIALRRLRRADMRPHLRARLNLAAAHRESGLNALLRTLGRHDVAELDYALLEQHGPRAAELFGRLRLAETADLYTYFRYFGDFRTASWLRVRLLEAHLREQERTAHVVPTALAAALELARPDSILEITRSKPVLDADRSVVDELTAVACALSGDGARAERIWSQRLSDADRAFGGALRGRTIAIVGPAPAVEDLAAEIDSFDVIARTNYLGAVDPRYGSRTDVSYYNGTRLVTRRKEISSVGHTVRWLVSVRSADAQLREMLPGHPGIRTGHAATRMFVDANPLAIPNILTDLLRFRPGRIKMFGVDFFAAPTAYSKEYHAHTVGSDAISHSIRVHESFSSFRFVQQLKGVGLCEGDARAERVLNMTLEQYAARLQEVHGHCTVANQNPQKKWHSKP